MQGLPIHLDGARVFNAAVALGVDIKAITGLVTSVQFCLSKVSSGTPSAPDQKLSIPLALTVARSCIRQAALAHLCPVWTGVAL